MPVDLKVVAGPEFDRTAAELRSQARKLQRRVSTAAKKAVDGTYKPVLVGGLPTFLPDRYAGVLGPDLKVSTSVRFAGSAPGVGLSITAPTGGPQGRDIRALEFRGVLAHPLFGNRGHWYRQQVTRGFASKPLKAVQPQIVRELDAALENVADEVRGA